MTALSYCVAVDVGTSRVAAATGRPAPTGGGVLAASLGLGRSADTAPCAIFVADGELLFGDAAERRGLAQPERLIREFKRRIGDDVPILAGDQTFDAEDLYARMVSWVVDRVTEREGHAPSSVVVTVPATWGEHRLRSVSAALAREVSVEAELMTEPEAAARHYEATHPLEESEALGVYDLGGGTFDAVVLRKRDGEVTIVGDSTGLVDLGGADFDDAIVRHVVNAAGTAGAVDVADASTRLLLAALRRECVAAKESLSFDSEVVVPVVLGDRPVTVRLTRSEFEGMIDSGLERTVEVFGRAVDSASLSDGDMSAILLTGGSSRIPRIAQVLSERFDAPIAIDADPKAIVALGASRARALELLQAETAGFALDAEDAEELENDDEPAFPRSEPRPELHKRRWFRRTVAVAAITCAALILAVGFVLSNAAALVGNAPLPVQAVAVARGEWPVDLDGFGTRLDRLSSEGARDADAAETEPAEPDADADAPPAPPAAEGAPVFIPQKATGVTPRKAAPAGASNPSSASGAPAASGGAATPAAQAPPAATTPLPAGEPEPQPTPEPEPAPQPEPEPTPEPEPEPQPVPEPQPEPSPDPVPAEDPAPAPVDPAGATAA